ncbi:MAG: hypothetical protein WC263_02460 [Candidatus Micrarchaeia archaeon]
MRFAFALVLAACALLLAGCMGGGRDGSPENAAAGNGSGDAGQEAAAQPQGEPPVAPQAPEPETAGKSGSAAAAKPEYINYCYATYWKGTLSGAGRNRFDYDRCGDYNYSMKIDVTFSMPFDLAAYLAGKDFNFMDCPGLPEGAANGSRDISIAGNFRSVREITSQVENTVDRRPDRQSTSSGMMYISRPYGLAFAAYPRQDARAAASGAKAYPHLVASRCTWEGGVQVQGYGEALISGAEAGGFAVSDDMRSVSGTWAMNGTLAGNYTLEQAGLR